MQVTSSYLSANRFLMTTFVIYTTGGWLFSMANGRKNSISPYDLYSTSYNLRQELKKDIPGEPLTPNDFSSVSLRNHHIKDISKGKDPIEFAGLYEGDINVENVNIQTFENGVIRNAIVSQADLWPNAEIPYVISSAYNEKERGVIAMGMKFFHDNTCIRFVPRTFQRDYIHIVKSDGCSSSVGRIGGAQAVSLGSGCIYPGIVAHELMHTTGFWHEQSRNDRDDFVNIYWSNIQQGMQYNFQKYDWKTIQSLGVEYDLESIMHYGPYAFSRDRRRPTILSKNGQEIGQRRKLSKKDILKMQTLYMCSGTEITAFPDVSTSTTTTTSKPEDTCVDINEYCPKWAKAKECERNPDWMKPNCMKSCGECEKVKNCIDASRHCAMWANEGECQKNTQYMNLFCSKSCGICDSKEVTSTTTSTTSRPLPCKNLNRYCVAWASSGECENNPTYMQKICARACGKC